VRKEVTDNAIDICSLSRTFGKKQTLQNVTFSVPKGSVFGLVGENGAGKTTLLKHVVGLLKASSDFISLFGLDPLQEPAMVLGKIGYLPEDRDLPTWMRIDQLMHYRSAFYPNWDDDYAKELVMMFDLDVHQRIRSLSRGQLA
jgi:ABC-2 type transport system ATP-binding protein